MNETFMPPSPPSPLQEKTQENGTFEYITDLGDRKMLATAYKAITVTENWEFLKNQKEISYHSPEIHDINAKINEFGYAGHSGSSFTMTMRVMQFIANHGEAKFREDNQK